MNIVAPLALAFLAPGLFLAGAGLVAVPILIHFLNRRRYRVVQWAAMEYLLLAMKKNRRRLRFESLLLLVTRCLVLLFLGAALARPFGCSNSSLANLAGHPAGLHVIVIDNGYAMGYQFNRPSAKTHLEQAKLIARELINHLSAGSEAVAIVTTVQTGAPIPTPTYDLDAAKSAVDRIDQTYGLTDMPAALEQARQIAEAAGGLPTRSLYILDDSTRHVWAAPNATDLASLGHKLADTFQGGITHFNLGVPNEFNALVSDLTPGQRLATLVPDFAPSFTAALRAYGQGSDPRLAWRIDGVAVQSEDDHTPRLGPTDTFQTLSRALFTTGGPHAISASLAGEDKLPCDDTRWRVVNVASDLKMLVVEGQRQVGSAGGSGLYIRAALDPQGDTTTAKHRLVAIDTISDLELATQPLGDYRCVVLCGAGNLSDNVAERLEKFVSAGGALWIFMGPQVDGENYNSTLLKHHLLPGPLVRRLTVAGGNGKTFDFDPAKPVHPLLEPFYHYQDSGLESARVFSYWQMALPANTTAERVLDFQADPGAAHEDPAITVQSIGRGRVIFCSTAADANDEWTTFPAKKAFPEVILCLFLGTVNTGDDWMNLAVGQSVQTPPEVKLTAAPHLRDARGVEWSMLGDNGIYSSVPLTTPGLYTMSAAHSSWPIAVNVPAQEGDTRLVDSQTIARVLGNINIDFENDEIVSTSGKSREASDFGWPLMLAVFALLGGESLMAMKFGRYKRT